MNDFEVRAMLVAEAKSQKIRASVLVQIEKNLNIASVHLTAREQQERMLLRIHLEKNECPWCDSMVSYFECLPGDVDYKIGYGPDAHVCCECGKRIVQVVPIMGSWRWGKHKDDKNQNRRRA